MVGHWRAPMRVRRHQRKTGHKAPLFMTSLAEQAGFEPAEGY